MPATTFCLNHRHRPAAAMCTSCGHLFCRECITEFGGRMMCSSCHEKKTAVQVTRKWDWFVFTTSAQVLAGLALLWFSTWLLGRILVSIPSAFHEGATWEK